jgi:hypothetical protein
VIDRVIDVIGYSLIAGWIAFAAGFFLTGCGASALQTHAAVASTVGAAVNEACQSAIVQRGRESRDVLVGVEYREDAATAIAEVRGRWEPVLGSCEAVRGAHEAWVRGLEVSVTGEEFTWIHGVGFVRPVIDAWVGLSRALASAGVDFPRPPAELVQLARAVSQ